MFNKKQNFRKNVLLSVFAIQCGFLLFPLTAAATKIGDDISTGGNITLNGILMVGSNGAGGYDINLNADGSASFANGADTIDTQGAATVNSLKDEGGFGIADSTGSHYTYFIGQSQANQETPASLNVSGGAYLIITDGATGGTFFSLGRQVKIDVNGNFVTNDGKYIDGFLADSNGNIGLNTAPGRIQLGSPLDPISIDRNGVITEQNNGVQRTVGQFAIAMFNNAGGLTDSGNGYYTQSMTSGLAITGYPGESMQNFANTSINYMPASGDMTYYLPTTYANSGDVLMASDNGGILTWQQPPNFWTDKSGIIMPATLTDNVEIGRNPSGHGMISLNSDGSASFADGNFSVDDSGQTIIGGGVTLNKAASQQPDCDENSRGMLWFVQGTSGVADSLQICVNDGSDNYSWMTMPFNSNQQLQQLQQANQAQQQVLQLLQ
jgi:flagellar basal body rod protein FlgG